MSQRREIEARLALFDELSGILGAMRSFALAELRRINKREASQQRVMQALSLAVSDLSETLAGDAAGRNESGDIWLLFGSSRGFCGSFNEDVLQFWRSRGQTNGSLILVGERLHSLLSGDFEAQRLPGAQGGLDATATIDGIVAAIDTLRHQDRSGFRLIACIRDEAGARCQQLWPLAVSQRPSPGYPPLTLAPAAEVAAEVAEHYLYHALLGLLLRSIRIENHMRLMQMDAAMRHLEHGGEELQRQKNRLRQEEIVEEIELMIGGKRA